MDAPQFDFSGVSRKWKRQLIENTRRMQVTQAKIAGAQLAADGELLEVLYAELADLEDADEALAKDVIAGIPRDWLTEKAPKGVEDSADAYDYLRMDKETAFGEKLSEAMQNPAGKSGSTS